MYSRLEYTFNLSEDDKELINELIAVYCGDLLSQEARWFW